MGLHRALNLLNAILLFAVIELYKVDFISLYCKQIGLNFVTIPAGIHVPVIPHFTSCLIFPHLQQCELYTVLDFSLYSSY